jgi:hypothetical protein
MFNTGGANAEHMREMKEQTKLLQASFEEQQKANELEKNRQKNVQPKPVRNAKE